MKCRKVNQLTVQIQDLQEKVNSLNGSRDFHDLETASSSGLSHVPSHPVIVPSCRGMLSRDSCLQLDTRNSFDTSENVFEGPLAPFEPTASCLGNVHARSLTATHCELVQKHGKICCEKS